MPEKIKGENPQGTGPEAFSDAFAGGNGEEGKRASIEVVHGVYSESYAGAGMKVRDIRSALQSQMNIPAEATPVVDGEEAGDDTVVMEGQILNFVRPAGEKG